MWRMEAKVSFDGDEMNLELHLDRKEYEDFKRLAPHLNVADTHAPFTISKSVALPKPLVSTMANWMHGPK